MGKQRKIVVLEDDKASCHLLSAFLEKQGHHVIQSHEARFAIELSLKEKPDLLIADVMLPDMHGSEAVKQLRASQTGKDLKVLFLTSLLDKKGARGKELSLSLNGEDFPALAKPFKPDLLTQVVTSIFEKVDAECERIEAEEKAAAEAKAESSKKVAEEKAEADAEANKADPAE